MATRREFLTLAASVPLVGLTAEAASEVKILDAGFRGFASALAAARVLVGTDHRVSLCVREDRLLATWPDDGHFGIVETSRLHEGKWRLETRGLCMEFMLRMEVMGPIASTPHPRPGQVWEPTLRVADARRLMLRMLAESRVDIVYSCNQVAEVGGLRAVEGMEFIDGQIAGARQALAQRLGKESLDESLLQSCLARDLALPG